ncbi:hypothetical protein BGX21_003914 [Mortierella sp. AD011]|nr:hypothetical protein BGX20_010591 [Mortierella sp. AD010]KAF9404026.1 hypothetical protein BGX21_003914 [Mortierella sp. AD011]
MSVPNDGVKIRVPPPSVINSVFIYLLFGPFLLDLPSVISSGTFLAQKKYTNANTAIAVHFLTLGGVLLVATIIYYFTLDQLTKAMAEYTVPSELTLVHVGVSPNVEFSGGQTFTLSPPTEREKEEDEIWDTSLAKARHRLISIRNAGTAMLSFYVIIYSIYGISRPLIHSHIVWNIVFCVVFNLDPGTPTIYAYFIFSILYHINARSSCLPQTDPLPRPPMVHIPASRPSRPRSDSYLFDLRRPSVAGVGPSIPRRSPSMRSVTRSMDLHSLSRADTITDKNNHLDQGQTLRNHTAVNMESTLSTQKGITSPN